ncbi:uncharacterized protein LOC110674263 [Aedes aegypti]|uniref:Uncharacterized protein n=1 Tax=Aedes aegypti TaxID=7159 RepID=A0A6I8U4R6_AEDAE|nr:uncharacterized protein LOC110674263 [Aedes aegypti]
MLQASLEQEREPQQAIRMTSLWDSITSLFQSSGTQEVRSEWDRTMEQRNLELISTLKRTTDPTEFATVVRKGAQMDLTCLQAVPEALKKLNINIPNLAIYVLGDTSKTYKCGSSTKGVSIDLDLRNNHFELHCGANLNQKPRGKVGSNDCLFESLAQAIPQLLDVPASEFHSGNIRGRSTDRDGSRSRRSRSRSLSVHDDPEEETSTLEHLLTRFYGIFDVAGVVQGVAERARINRNEVLRGGRSQHQDRHSSDVRLHASHVIRIQITDGATNQLSESNTALYTYLTTQIGYTELVETWANKWGGIGKDIDELQALLLKLLESVDFSHDSPRMMPNVSLKYLQNTVDELNELLRRIDPYATAITLTDQGFWASLFGDNVITADTIVGICKDSFITVLNKWLRIDRKHFMNEDSIKNVLEQVLKIIKNTNLSKLLQLGRKAFKKLLQLLLTKQKCDNGKNDRQDKDKDDEDGENKSSSGNKAKNGAIWSSVKETVQQEARCNNVNPSSFLKIAGWILLGVALVTAIAFAIYMVVPCIINLITVVDTVTIVKTIIVVAG